MNINSSSLKNSIDDNSSVSIWFRFPYLGAKSIELAKSCIAKIKRNCKKNTICFKLLYDTTKVEFFTNTKDRIPLLCQSSVVYEFMCPGWHDKYIGKTERTLHERILEHAWYDNNSAVRKHIDNCTGVHHIIGIRNFDDDLFNDDVNPTDMSHNLRSSYINMVKHNVRVLDKSDNWNILLIKKALINKYIFL